MAPTKPASRARKVITPEVTEQAPKPVALQPGPARRSRAATKSTESTESEPTKPTRKTTTRGTKAGTASEADVETEAEPAKGGLRRGTRTRNQSVEAPAAPAPVPAPAVKRRVGTKSKKAALDPPTEEGGPDPSLGRTGRTKHPEVPPTEATAKAGTPVRGRRGKTKVAAPETEDESTGTDVGTATLRVARGGKPTPTANVGKTTGAASNRAPTATATAGKGRRAGAAASSGKNAVRTVGEKENTPEQIHVKEEEDEKSQLPSGAMATKSGRVRKGAAVAAPRALSETEKDVTAPKTRAPRKRAASGKK